MAGRRYDEDDVRVRPSRRSRPRTRNRPSHDDAVDAVVVAVDRGRYTCLVEGVPVVAMRARELGRRSVVVGDRVALVGDTSGRSDTLARLVRIADRTSTLRRTADDTDPVESVVVANADQLVVVTAAAAPEPNTRLIDRCLVAAFDAGIDAVVCVTKSDLADPSPLAALYEPVGTAVVATTVDDPASIEVLRERLQHRTSALVGPSGVGKSTLVNLLVPSAERSVGAVSDLTGKGRHTSTSAVALALPGGGWVVDTPGIRSFGLAHVTPDGVLAAFPDLAAAAEQACPRGCDHLDPEVCGLDAAVAGGDVDARRLESLRRLLASRPSRPGD